MGTDIYEGWTKEMEIGDWLIDFDVNQRPASFTGYWRVEHTDEKNDLTFVREVPCVDIPTIGPLEVSKEDMSRLKKWLGAAVGKSGPVEMITPVAEAVASLDKFSVPASAKAFDRAMLGHLRSGDGVRLLSERIPFDGRKAGRRRHRQTADQ